jgi:Zn-dependent protease with chaperone function
MRERWGALAFAVGLGAFCALGFALGHHLAGVGTAVTLSAALFGLLLAVAALRHLALVRGLRRCSVPVELTGTPVRVGRFGDTVFVAGLRRPAIYCDERLLQELTPGEMRAVLLHEQAHQRAFDPARLLVLGLLAPMVRPLPAGRQWLASALARREVAADRYALANGARRGELASALVKLPPLMRAQVAGFTPAMDLRLQALLGDIDDVTTPAVLYSTGMFLLGGLFGAVTCTWLLHGLLTAILGPVCC